jgi:hypothetical protein
MHSIAILPYLPCEVARDILGIVISAGTAGNAQIDVLMREFHLSYTQFLAATYRELFFLILLISSQTGGYVSL